MKRILHLDMDAFFAAVEERRKPELRGKPVVIGGGGDPSSRGVVSTASYEARKYGIHSALPLRTAYRLCPQAIFLPVDYDEYVRCSVLFKAVLRRFSHAMEDVGIDEAYLDLSESERPAEEIAREIKKQILDETGLTCSIGIAPNKLLAKIGSDMQKPDGLTILGEEDVSARIWPMSARKLLGVGPKTETRLKEMGIDTIGQLAALPLERLTGEFGQSYGRYLYDASRGIDDSPIVTHWEPRSMSREMTFETDVSNWQVIAKTMAELTKDVVKSMREDGYRGRTVTLKIRFSDFETHTRSISLREPVDSEETIRRTVFECLKKVELKKRVRLIGVRMSNLEKTGSRPRNEDQANRGNRLQQKNRILVTSPVALVDRGGFSVTGHRSAGCQAYCLTYPWMYFRTCSFVWKIPKWPSQRMSASRARSFSMDLRQRLTSDLKLGRKGPWMSWPKRTLFPPRSR